MCGVALRAEPGIFRVAGQKFCCPPREMPGSVRCLRGQWGRRRTEGGPPSASQAAFLQEAVDALAQLADLLLQGCHLRPRRGLLLGVLLLDQ